MDKNYSEKPSEEFLAELVERARRLGWSRDYTEITYFVEDLYRQLNIDFKMPAPYEDE